MRGALLRCMVVIALCLAGNGTMLAGRGDKAGTSGANALLLPVGARAIGLSGASLANIDGLEAAYWNPAGIARSSSATEALFSHMNYIADIGLEFAAVGARIGDAGSIALAVKSVSYGDIPVTTEEQPDGTGEIAHPSSLVATIAIARSITDHITVGFSGNVVSETMEKVSATGFAFTGGIQYMGLGGIDRLGVGVVIRNIGPPIQFGGEGLARQSVIDGSLRDSSPMDIEASEDDLPSTIEIGLSYVPIETGRSELTVNSTFQNNNYADDEYHIGAEYIYDRTFAIRLGTTYTAASEHGMGVFGPSIGFGLVAGVAGTDVRVDYAFRSVQLFDGIHVISLAVNL